MRMMKNMERVVPLLLMVLVGQSWGADFFTGMDRHIGCFFDQPNDRCCWFLFLSPRSTFRPPFKQFIPQGPGSKGPTDWAFDNQGMYQGLCKDVLQVCWDAGIVINIPVMSKTTPFVASGRSFLLLWELIWTTWSRKMWLEVWGKHNSGTRKAFE